MKQARNARNVSAEDAQRIRVAGVMPMCRERVAAVEPIGISAKNRPIINELGTSDPIA